MQKTMNKRDYIELRVKAVARFIIETGSTIRATAKHFGVSKSTIQHDMVEKLPKMDMELSSQVSSVIEKNKAERHIRGGESTRKKFLKTNIHTN